MTLRNFSFLRFLDHVFEVYGDDARVGVCMCMKDIFPDAFYRHVSIFMHEAFCECVYRNQF